ncbi:MAG: glutamate-1-semialdehyde 2,1-aminomutase [Candidatus Eiseniibacteriota bacterium]
MHTRADRVMPGGVNSPVRAYGAVGGDPPFIASAAGARVRDADGREYIDYVGSWGPMILGHAAPTVVEAVRSVAPLGTSFGAPTALEVEMAELVCSMVPSVEQVRMVCSGTEATMSAVRLARAATGRDTILKFEGCYHGHGDSFLIQAGSGAATFGQPSSPGVTRGTAADTFNATYNDLASVEAIVAAHGPTLAAIIVEPVAANMGTVLPAAGFLEGLRALCDRHGALLIFDEVITGFRLAPGGAQERFGVLPDLTTLGKVIGGGLPVGAYGGRAELMRQLAPVGPVYQAGTLAGNPLAMAAGLAQLRALDADPSIYERLERLGTRLENGLREVLAPLDLRCQLNRIGSLSCMYFTDTPVVDWPSAARSDTERFGRYFRAMLEEGVYLAPSQFEAAFISAAHTDADIDRTIEAAGRALHRVVA